MMATIELPADFSELQPFVSSWGLATEDERAATRRSSQPAELEAFYKATLRHLPAILGQVDHYPIGGVPEPERTLFYLALSLAEVAPHVEFYKGSPGVPFAFAEERMIGAHAALAD